MILVTGAAGKTGKAVIKALVDKKIKTRALLFKAEYAEAIYQIGESEIVVGNLLNLPDLMNAMRNVDAVYHICPNMHPDEIEIGNNIIKAVKNSACRRIVYHSVLHPHTVTMPHHWNKLKVEASLFESGLDYTILQPSAYMQNIVKDLIEIIVNQAYFVPYNTNSKFSFVDLADISEVASIVITTPGYSGAIYELNGPEILSVKDVVEIIKEESKRNIKLKLHSETEWMNQAGFAGLSDYKRSCLRNMFEYYDKYGFWGNSKVLEWILNRKATSIRQRISQTLSKTRINQ